MNLLTTPVKERQKTIEEYINKYLPKYGKAAKTAAEAGELFVNFQKRFDKHPISTTNGRIIWGGETFEIYSIGGGTFKVRKL